MNGVWHPQNSYTKKVRNMTKKSKKVSGEWKDWALLASALGHIVQGVNQSSTKTTLRQTEEALLRITEAKNYFEGKLREWQKAYSLLQNRVDSLERELLQYQKAIEHLKKQQQEMDKENSRLKEDIKNNP